MVFEILANQMNMTKNCGLALSFNSYEKNELNLNSSGVTNQKNDTEVLKIHLYCSRS